MTKTTWMTAGALAIGLLAASAAPAYAQDPAAAPPEPKLHLDIGLVLGFPSGDWEGVDMSPGARITLGYTIVPNVSIQLSSRYILVQPEGDVPDDFSIWQFDIAVGGRYTVPLNPQTMIYGEAEVYRSEVGASFMGDSTSDDGIGFGLGGGAIFKLGEKLGVYGAVRYTTADINDATTAWLSGEGGINIFF